MDIYQRLDVVPLINAADSLTTLGGSVMPQEVAEAMIQASHSFIDLNQLQQQAGKYIANITQNEAAFISSGASAGLALCSAALLTQKHPEYILQLPQAVPEQAEIIIQKTQRTGYDQAVSQTGAIIVDPGTATLTTAADIKAAISEKTVGIFYFAGTPFETGAVGFPEIADIANSYNIPLIVDAAAQLPPVSNLWYYTQNGATAAIFSGGKTLRGPQASGLIVGKKWLIETITNNANPFYSVGRPMKAGKEEIAGLVTAIRRYVNLDIAQEDARMWSILNQLNQGVAHLPFKTVILEVGPTGQDYPRVALFPEKPEKATQLKDFLWNSAPKIAVTLDSTGTAVILNPLHLVDEDVPPIVAAIQSFIDI